MQRHRHQEFIRFLNADRSARVPAGKTVHVVARQLRHPQASQGEGLAEPASALHLPLHPDLRPPGSMRSKASLPSSPDNGSNAASSRSIVELQAAINRFIAETNDNPKPFVWTADRRRHPRRRQARETSVRSRSTLMSAVSRCRRVNSWLACKRLFRALPGRAGGAVVETTVDHTLMRGSEPHDR